MPHALHADKLIDTIATLQKRVEERLPGSGLSRRAAELTEIARQSAQRVASIRRPAPLLRGLTWLLIAGLAAFVAYVAANARVKFAGEGWEMLQGIDAAISSVVFLGGAAFFAATLERRVKRARALAAIQDLRVLSHIIDMHQLTKDPDRAFHKGEDTASSPKETLSPFLLGRYLDYCSEMLSLISKLGVLYAQDFDDEVVLAAVDDIENLTTGLSRKIWQKIMLLNQMEATAKSAGK
jgi:hypothetical protein